MEKCPDDFGPESGAWSNTRLAVAQFRKLLLCSKCSQLMSEPVCLGLCEHMFCRSCAATRAGDGCSVCHSPAWVSDIQINRQLNNITQLFRQLDSLLNPGQPPATPPTEPSPSSTETAVCKPRKNVKIWFSPRSRKMRCKVTDPPGPAPRNPELPGPPSKAGDLSVFNFNSSSQDSGSSSPCDNGDHNAGKKRKATRATAAAASKKKKKNQGLEKRPETGQKPATRKQNQLKLKKQRLNAINRLWGINQLGQEDVDQERSSKRVSFQCPGLPGKPVLEDSLLGEPLRTADGCAKSPPVEGATSEVTESQHSGDPESAKLAAAEGTPERAKPDERPRPQDDACAETTPKRRRRPSVQRGPIQFPPASPRPRKLSGGPQEGPEGASFSPRTPTIRKRNHRGETLLHLAAIKGDVGAVKELLEQGADPNLKDHAAWTPLHEACNLGHLEVVEALLQQGALMNTPGYQNDSPLHDAVRNGHTTIVKLLLERGACLDVLNMFGLRPADYAETAEMQAVLQAACGGPRPHSSPLSPPGSSSKVAGAVRREGCITLLGSKLTRAQQNRLAKLARLLGARHVESFSGSVTHVVVPDTHMPTTMSCFHGVLRGCWVLKFDWVNESLQAEGWADESGHEVGGGPSRSRLNRNNLLPLLFDGCFFFFLGAFQRPSKEDLLQLVKEGGGQVLSRKPKPDSDVTQTLSAAAYHAPPGSDQTLCTQYVLYDPLGPYRPPRVRLGKVWSAPSTWLLDCIASFQLLPVPQP